jgi:hypothetical protein
MSPNQPMASQIPMISTTDIVPLDHFTVTTSNFVTVSDQLLVGSHSILPLQLANSTMVPQAMPIYVRNAFILKLLLEHHFLLDQIHDFPLGIMF